MNKLVQCIQLVMLSLWVSHAVAAIKISEIEFNDTKISDVTRTLSELSNSNIIATPAATKKKVTIHLKNTTVENALKSISRITDLWYRYDDDTNTFRLMTREEYGKDLIVRDSERVEIFKVRYANIRIIAQAIEDLYGSRVVLSLGEQVSGGTSSSSSGTVRNSRSTNSGASASRSSRGGSSANNTPMSTSSLTIDQFEKISQRLNESSGLDGQALQEVTAQAQPIFITVNNEHNMIIVRTDDTKVLKTIDKIIKTTDIAVPQVMLEMKILNIVLGEDFNSIFNFELQPSGSNASPQPVKVGNNSLLNSGSFIYEFLNSRLRANIEFLEQNKRVNVLSNPMVLASNHREAELFIGEESLLVRGFTYNPPVINNNTIVSPSYIETETELEEIGITLRITPRINGDNSVTLELEQESSTINKSGAVLPIAGSDGTVLNLPVDTVNSSRLTGTVVARDNLTVAVGGLIRTTKSNTEKKVPLLGEIPLLGRAFRSDIESEEETETVLLITPRILNNPEDSERIRKTDNRFYQDLNRGHPELQPGPNKFIKKNISAADTKNNINTQLNNRQALYLEMSQYAAETVRINEIERIRNDLYRPVKVNSSNTPIFKNPVLDTRAVASWQRGGMYVTAVKVSHKQANSVDVDYQNINGVWLASSTETESLKAGESTYLYLISALSFDQVIANAK